MKSERSGNNSNPRSILQDLLSDKDYVFAIISASKPPQQMSNNPGEYREQIENDQKNNEILRNDVRRHHFGFRKISGHYVISATNGTVCAEDCTLIITKADSSPEFRLLLPFCKALAEKFNQSTFLYKGTDNELKLYFADGKAENLGIFVPDKFKDYMSVFIAAKNKCRKGRFVIDDIGESTSTRGWAANTAAHAHLQFFEKTGRLAECTTDGTRHLP